MNIRDIHPQKSQAENEILWTYSSFFKNTGLIIEFSLLIKLKIAKFLTTLKDA